MAVVVHLACAWRHVRLSASYKHPWLYTQNVQRLSKSLTSVVDKGCRDDPVSRLAHPPPPPPNAADPPGQLMSPLSGTALHGCMYAQWLVCVEMNKTCLGIVAAMNNLFGRARLLPTPFPKTSVT